jgi:hypothetical protein
MQPWSPFPEAAPPDQQAKAIRMACIHLAAHVLEGGPAAPITTEDGPAGLAIATDHTSPAQKIADVIDGARRLVEFIDSSGSVSPHTVALETIREIVGGEILPGEAAWCTQVRHVVNGALGR